MAKGKAKLGQVKVRRSQIDALDDYQKKEIKRRAKGDKWGMWGGLAGSGLGLLGAAALAPFTGGASLLYASAAGAAGAGLGAYGGSSLGRQWAGGREGQAHKLGTYEDASGNKRKFTNTAMNKYRDELEDYQDDAKLQQKTFAINSAIKGLMSPITMGADKWNTMGSAVRGGLSESVLGTGYYGLRNAMSNTASTLGMNEYVNAPVGEHMVNRAEAPSFGPAPPSQIQRDTADHFANARRSIVDPATPPIHPRFANSINQAMLNQVPSAYRTNMSFNPAGTSGPNPAIVSGNQGNVTPGNAIVNADPTSANVTNTITGADVPPQINFHPGVTLGNVVSTAPEGAILNSATIPRTLDEAVKLRESNPAVQPMINNALKRSGGDWGQARIYFQEMYGQPSTIGE